MLIYNKSSTNYPFNNTYDMGQHDPIISFLQSEIYQAYGDTTRVSRKSLHKFGRLSSLGTSESEINYLGIDSVHSTTNSITHFSSADGGDTQTLRVEGMTISGGLLTFVAQDITLAGQTKTALTTPLSRVTRIANVSSATATSGDVYVYEGGAVSGGIPTDLNTVGNVMPAEDQSTLFAGTSISSTNYFLCTGFYAYLAKKTSGFADIKLKTREISSVYRTVQVVSIGASAPAEHKFNPPLIVKSNSDIDLVATGSTTNLDVCAGFDGYFADIV